MYVINEAGSWACIQLTTQDDVTVYNELHTMEFTCGTADLINS
jgi:hypothetical protein